jgi:hypothetical protein
MVVLATKVYVDGDARERALRSLEGVVGDRLGDLEVSFEVGLRHDDFPTVTVEGTDETVARAALAEEFGAVDDVREGEPAIGTLEAWDEDGFVLDAGEQVRVPAEGLGLGTGTPSQVRERFGLVQHLPMEFVRTDEGVRLTDAERDRLYDWRRGPGRLNVNSATRSEVRATLNRAGHARDVVRIERLGLLEQSVVCTEGTDPPGLVASVGTYLPAELRCVV